MMADQSSHIDTVTSLVNEQGGPGRFQVRWFLEREISEGIASLMVEHGRAFGASEEVIKDAQSRRCHQNCMEYISEAGGSLWFGFALSGEVWRVHSWVVRDNKVIEVTPSPRERYFGVVVDSREKFDIVYAPPPPARPSV